MKLVLISLLILAFLSQDDCDCEDMSQPVCGIDRITYLNKCEADCKRAVIAYEGVCSNEARAEECSCEGQKSPVCGVDDVTYDSLCHLSCAKVELKSHGACWVPEKPCSNDPKLFCGEDKETYFSECGLREAGVKAVYKGKCRKRCECGENFAPVCSRLGTTFKNECYLICSGEQRLHSGRCEDSPCNCGESVEPVFSKSGKTYHNKCALKCAKESLSHIGECQAPKERCHCALDSHPVCSEKVTFRNECQALCSDAKSFSKGSCEEKKARQKKICECADQKRFRMRKEPGCPDFCYIRAKWKGPTH